MNEKLSYSAIHKLLKKHFGKLKECVYCGSETNIENASISHMALPSFDDYIPLCKSCHKKYDRWEKLPWWRKVHPAFRGGAII